MKVYMVVPTPTQLATGLSVDRYRYIRDATGVTGIRFNLDWRHADWRRLVDTILEAGLIPLPVLDDEHQPGYTDDQKPSDCINWWVRACQAYHFPLVEMLNEPSIIPGRSMSPETYANTVNRFLVQMSSLPGLPTKVAVANEHMLAGGKRHGDYWQRVQAALHPDHRPHYAAIHPYRYGGDAWMESRMGSWWSPKSRLDEHRAWVASADGLPLVVTEVGWNLAEVTAAYQAVQLEQELLFLDSKQIPLVCIYTYKDDGMHRWGVFNDDWSPRPAVGVLRQWGA